MPILLNDAMSYAKRGLQVFPLTPNSKIPLKGTQGSKEATSTPEQVKTWWTNNPDCNIGVATRGFIVLDIDINHVDDADGYHSLEVLEDTYNKLPETLTVKTASGGRHLYFKLPEGVELPQKIAFLNGVDIKANPNNYVLLPPSRINGDAYTFENKQPMADLPEWLTGFILKRNKIERASRGFSANKRYRSRVTELIEILALGFETGRRNDTAAKITGQLLAYAVDVRLAWQLVQYANGNSSEPLLQNELERTFESIARRELGATCN
ncbi:bifunctional DNA primase/polymerase [Latilactobacillus sakei subsp. carnosus]|uniref:bifunctional DNA primase/polymerase n=1 Tax=Latilactobacillus TaxID=2767885 RepID=UPI000C1246BB|nr:MULTISPECIES: bifunctional DNA primase/polymerase [Latilactobacillus]MCM1571071.1 bifunctional DNA primase/polymerase [Latilactobacillus sakei]MDV8937758.1 bifunctional DNA primase/polymerase [Latilactobacillus sp.]MDV8939420.1 bifunctional DNA primase/polymerase [Latilactobacillus sp.]MDV8941204.1 bifunctional DNA primase/polymerase [Latilactobacillus sp.]MDV8943063.1 bifunctional DNA primase/polymerase [Latilactobacillus sp.]